VSIPGAGAGAISAGEHVCALYTRHDQRIDTMLPYVREGLRSGSRCIAFVGDPTPAELVDGLDADLDSAGRISSGQLEVGGADDTFFTPDEFDIDKMLAFWRARIAQGTAAGFDTVRLTVDAAWWGPQLPAGDALIQYESELNRLAGQGPQSILCLYDLSNASGSFVLDILKVHSRVFLGALELPNPYYLTPDEFLAKRTRPVANDSRRNALRSVPDRKT
jgi:hypothetical protein